MNRQLEALMNTKLVEITRSGFTITFHDCGRNSYYIAKRGNKVFTSKDLNYIRRKTKNR